MNYKVFIRCFFTGFLIVFFSLDGVIARELCDCFGSCVKVYPREVSSEVKRSVRVKNGYSARSRVEIDHRLPLSLGGTNDIYNLQPLLPEVHRKKTEHDMLMLRYVYECYMTIDEARKEAVMWKP